MTRRELCLHLPFLQTERLIRTWEPAKRKGALLAIAVRRSNTLTLAAVSAAAFSAGVRAGMTLAQARAIIPELETADRNEHEERKALLEVAEFAYNFAPRVALAPPTTLIVNVAGCERLHGGEQKLAEKLRLGLSQRGLTARIAIADNPAAAVALAVSSNQPVTVSAPGRALEDIRNVPLSCLALEGPVVAQLETLGVQTAGQLLDLPARALPARFGELLSTRLRQLRGVDDPVLENWMPPPSVRERLDFSGPTNNREALVEAVRLLAARLATRLAAKASGALGLKVDLLASEGPPVEFSLSLAAARNSAKALATVLLGRFETVDVGDHWFEGVQLTLLGNEIVPEVQKELFAAKGAQTWQADIASTVDELVGKLGSSAIVRADLTLHPDPRQSFRYTPWGSKAAPASGGRVVASHFSARFAPASYQVFGEATSPPRLWDFAANTGTLKVVGENRRMEFGSVCDYLCIEDEHARRHMVWRDPRGWHVPPELARRQRDLAAIERCGRNDSQQVMAYAELACATNFSFLRGASGPDAMVERAAKLGLHALAIADRHTLAGVVRAHARARELGLKILIGTRLPLRDGPDLCLYAMNRTGYASMCRLLTLGKLRTTKGDCDLSIADLPAHAGHLQAVLMNAQALPASVLATLRDIFGARLSFAVTNHFESTDRARNRDIARAAAAHDVSLVAVNDAHAASAEDRLLQSVVTCIRETKTLDEGASLVFCNGERHLKPGGEMAALLREYPEAIARSVEIADSCTFSMAELAYEYPDEVVPAGMDMQAFLEQETWKGAARRYPAGIPETVRAQVERELELIDELQYAAYFLTIHDIVQEAERRGILCQGRGSAANSAVCYCLGITAVPPGQGALLFERFISRERNEPPDIDVDFEHERREEIIQYIYAKYGRHRAGICSTVISYRSRSAIRDVGKVLGFSLDQIGRMAKSSVWWDEPDRAVRTMSEAGLSAKDGRAATMLALVAKLRGAPRHLSQHVGGFVITRSRLDELVPVENAAMQDRTFIEWNKDDIDALRILKVDCLALGMLTALKKCFTLVANAGGAALTRDEILRCDPKLDGSSPIARAIYGMLQKADAVGTFQVESRAQMSMLPRLKPARFYDLVVEVAIVRPGPIQGGMVHPYLRRRDGKEAIDYIYPALESVLKQTLGVPLFQEQAMQIAMVAANYSAGEADQLRRAMGSWRNDGKIAEHRRKLIHGMRAKGISEANAERVYKQIQGFASYGFPEAHAASFALITLVSAYLKRLYPAAFTAALLNSQPMGFYSASSLTRDAREHGVQVLAPCINNSDRDCTLESAGQYAPAALELPPGQWGTNGPALRLGLRLVRGLGEDAANSIAAARADGGKFRDMQDFIARVGERGLPNHQRYRSLVQLASADAFAALGLTRRDALWEVAALRHRAPQMFAETLQPTPAGLPPMSAFEHMLADYEMLELSLRAHPMEFIRDGERARGAITAAQMRDTPHGRKVEVGGRVINRQHPETAKGIIFMTLEDETDVANLIVKPEVFERHRKVALGTDMMRAKGKVERVGDVVHLVVESFQSLAEQFRTLRVKSRNFH